MAIAFLDLAASIPTKASLSSTMACPPCAEDRLGPPEQPSSRIVGRATSSAEGRTYGHRPLPAVPASSAPLILCGPRARSALLLSGRARDGLPQDGARKQVPGSRHLPAAVLVVDCHH